MDQFLEALGELPGAHAELDWSDTGGQDRRYDAQIDLWVAGKAVTLLVEVKKAFYPRDVRQTLWQLKDFANKWPRTVEGHQTAPLLVAQSISPGAKDLLRGEGVGYYDSGGSMFLPAESIYVYIDKPPPKNLSKSIRSLFSGRRAQVLQVLLMQPTEWFGVKSVAEQAKVSPATASQVLAELEKFDWVISRGQGPSKERHLREPGALLDAWVKQLSVMRSPAMRRYFVPAARAEVLVDKFAEACAVHNADYAITHEAAGQHYTPFLSTFSQVRCRLMAGAAADRALGELDARVVTEGANLAVIEVKSPGELLFREQVDGVWLASPVQVYLDLMRGEGRAKELAQHLRRERIGF
ncbi:MAG: hypothetical protein VX871_08415 [Pseudomonadota bacterium]|nr:hypothetical protein [Pseudomonadota bacterium]